jgi:predicted AAA+ superfamily ATPase
VRAVNNRFGELYPEEQGALFEGWIASILMAYKEYKDLFDEWYYWSPVTAQKTEVDFLLERSREYIAIEVKNSEKIRGIHLKGLMAITELPGLKKRILIYPGNKKMIMGDGIEIWPLYSFLEIVDAGGLWK